MYHNFLIYSSADGHLGCFHVLAIVNTVAMNIGIHVPLSILVSSGCVPRSGIAWSYGLNGHGFESTPGVGDGQGGLVCCDSWGHKESDTIERLD